MKNSQYFTDMVEFAVLHFCWNYRIKNIAKIAKKQENYIGALLSAALENKKVMQMVNSINRAKELGF